MLVTTTPIIEGNRIVKYQGIVSGETIIGANVFRDLFASIRDIVGGRSGAYEEVLRMAKDTALQEMQAQAAKLGANAVIGVDLDYETVGGSGSMLMVTANGTAVTIEEQMIVLLYEKGDSPRTVFPLLFLMFVPCLWHSCATALALLCQALGTSVPKAWHE